MRPTCFGRFGGTKTALLGSIGHARAIRVSALTALTTALAAALGTAMGLGVGVKAALRVFGSSSSGLLADLAEAPGHLF